MKAILLSVLFAVVAETVNASEPEISGEKRKKEACGATGYVSMLESPKVFQAFCGDAGFNCVNDVWSMDVVYNKTSGALYFINHTIYPSSTDFCSTQLPTPDELRGSTSPYCCAQLRYYRRADVYALALDGVGWTALDVRTLYHAVIRDSFLHNNLGVLVHTSTLRAMDRLGEITVPRVYPQNILEQQDYRVIHPGIAFGILRRVDKLEDAYNDIQPGDIIVIREDAQDLPLCAGIITTKAPGLFSEFIDDCVNLNRVAAFERSAWDDIRIDELEFRPVKLIVADDSLRIEPASQREMKAWQESCNMGAGNVLTPDLEKKELVFLHDVIRDEAEVTGFSAVTFAALSKPETAWEQPFVIPFSFYKKHLENAQVQEAIAKLYSDKMYMEVADSLHLQLKCIRHAIRNTPISEDLLMSVMEHIDTGSQYRFYASTNEVPSAGFSPGSWYRPRDVHGDVCEVEEAIYSMWTSVWNERTCMKRAWAGVDHSAVMMAVMVQHTEPLPVFVKARIVADHEAPMRYLVSVRNEYYQEQFELVSTEGSVLSIEYVSYHHGVGEPVLTLVQARRLYDELEDLRRHFAGSLALENSIVACWKMDAEDRLLLVSVDAPYLPSTPVEMVNR